jgi:hypothetical protein
MNDNQILVLRDNAKHELLQIKTVEEGISYLNKLRTIDVWVKAEKKDAELQNIIAEQKLRTQRILGELINEGQRKGVIATANDTLKTGSVMPDEKNGKQNIPDLGLSHKQSSTFKQIASIPDEDFEEFIHEKKQAVNNAVAELTTTGAVKLGVCPKKLQDCLNVEAYRMLLEDIYNHKRQKDNKVSFRYE